MPLSQTIIGIVGNVVSMGLFLSPALTFFKILKARSTQEYSHVPYVTTLLNCFLWLFYGSPWVVHGILVVTINGAGTVVELVYIVIFIVFASSKKRRVQVLYMTGCVIVLFALVVVLTMTLAHEKSKRKTIVGICCMVINVAMYASPLSVMRRVIKTKSTEFMPFWLSFFSFLNGVLWMTYGIIGNDIFIEIPNGTGAGFGLLQLVLYGCCCGGKREAHEPQIAAEKTVDPDVELADVRGTEKHMDRVNPAERS